MPLEHNPARRQRRRRDRGTSPRLAFTINEFCDTHGISRTHLYAMWRESRGPRYMDADGKRLISIEAAAEWRAQCEQTDPTQPVSKRGGKRPRRDNEAEA